MHKSAIIMPPLLAVVAGAVGFYLRHTELREVFDELTGLPERGALLTILLIALSCAVLLIGLIFSIVVGLRYSSPRGYENAFGTDTIVFPLFFFIVGIVWIVATVMHFFNMNSLEVFPLMDIFFIVLSGLSAVSLSLFAIEMYQDPRRKTKHFLSIAPTLFMCFWLILLYRQNASNPVLLSYAYFCLALIASALGFYLTSGFVFNKSAPGRTIFFCLASVFFCGVTLADDHSLAVRIIIATILVVNVAYSTMIIRNLKSKTAF